MPRRRWGFIHIVNNDYTHWLMYAIGGSSHPTILSQGNRFIAPLNPFAKEVTKRDYASESEWKNWNWRSEGDLMMNGAFFTQSGKKCCNCSQRRHHCKAWDICSKSRPLCRFSKMYSEEALLNTAHRTLHIEEVVAIISHVVRPEALALVLLWSSSSFFFCFPFLFLLLIMV